MFKQTTLLKFYGSLPEPKFPSLTRFMERSEQSYFKTDYKYHVLPDNTIEICETHCLSCNKRLYRNGFNFKHMLMDYGLGKVRFKIHRKRCPNCGEVPISLKLLGDKYAHKHENFKRRSRQLYIIGMRYRQIVRVFEICFNTTISKTSIYNWVKSAQKGLRKLLETTKIPSSGYIGYDEIFLKICGKKRYLMATVDVNTKFIPLALVVSNKEASTAKRTLTKAKRLMDEKLLGIVKDCTTTFGKLFYFRGWEHIELQDCVTPVKWIITKHVKAFAGLSEQSIKPIPEEWLGLLWKFYRVINSRYLSSAYCNLEILRYTINKFQGKRSKHLRVAFNFLESHLENILRWKSNPFLPKTNNMSEGYHKKYEYYPEFKKGMKLISGAQFVADLIVFDNNLNLFPEYIQELEDKIYYLPFLLDDPSEKRMLKGQKTSLSAKLKRVKSSYSKYLIVWEKYFQISTKY